MKRSACLIAVLLIPSVASARSADGVLPIVNPAEKALNLIYSPDDGGLKVMLHSGDASLMTMTSLLIQSTDNDFSGTKPANLGPLDAFRPDRLFKIDIAGFGPAVDFGTPLKPGKTPDELMSSLSVTGSLIGGGSLEQIPFHLIHPSAVPEPSGLALVSLGMLGFLRLRTRRALVSLE